MRLGWDEIKRRAKAFSEEWKEAHYEKGENPLERLGAAKNKRVAQWVKDKA